MPNAPLNLVLRHLRKLVGAATETTPDGVLLERFVAAREEQAFEELVARHGPMVYNVCRRILASEHDAADAYQATFLVLARNARSIRRRGSVASWLYGVACRVSRKARARAARLRVSDQPVNLMCEADPSSPAIQSELRGALDDALNDLPSKYRDPLVLCYLEGQTHEQAAQSLGWPAGTMSRRVGRGLEYLRERLMRRGVTMPSAILATALTGTAVHATPPGLAAATTSAALLFAEGAVGTAVSAQALALAEGTLHALHLARWKAVGAVLALFGLLSASVGAVYYTQAAEVRSAPAEDDFTASLDARIRDFQPTAAERKIDTIGWAADIRTAQNLAKTHQRPVFLFTHEGRIGTGRCGGSAFNLRAHSLADDRIIALINSAFIPVFTCNEDYRKGGNVAAEEKEALTRIYHEALNSGLPAGDDCIYLLAPDGKVLDVIKIKTAKKPEPVVFAMEQVLKLVGTQRGTPIIAPHPLSQAPTAEPGALVLHLVARIDHRNHWGEFPAENWIVLSPERAALLIDPAASKPGDAWQIEPTVSAELLTYFYPQTENNDLTKNRLEHQSLHATIVSATPERVRARIHGALHMKHSFYSRPDDNYVDATLIGFLDFDPTTRRVSSLRLMTDTATYGRHAFTATLRNED